MNPYLCLLRLQWLTGDDGRISFSKMILVAVLWMEGVLVYHLVDSGNLVESLWPLVWLFALTIAGSHGIKGLQLWFRSARLNVDGKELISKQISERRDQELGIDPAP